MKRLALVLALCGCTQHPALSVGIATGAVGLFSCELSDPQHQSTCAYIGGGVGLVLGGLTALVTLLLDTSAHQLPPDEELLPGGALRLRTHTEPPPGLLDGGVPDAGVPQAPVPADAVVSPTDA